MKKSEASVSLLFMIDPAANDWITALCFAKMQTNYVIFVGSHDQAIRSYSILTTRYLLNQILTVHKSQITSISHSVS